MSGRLGELVVLLEARGMLRAVVAPGHSTTADAAAPGDDPRPVNWRVHPKAQPDALAGALGQVGWVLQVLVNRPPGFVVDGHARVALALSS
jgi:hypothetical protein